MRIGDWIIIEKDDNLKLNIKVALMEKQILELVEELRKTRETMRKCIRVYDGPE